MPAIVTETIENKQAFEIASELPVAVQRRWMGKAVSAATRVVARDYRRGLPSSEKTGTRKKWSKKERARRGSFKPTKRSVRVFTNRGRNKHEISATLWVPTAAFLEFGNTKKTHKLWGRDSRQRRKERPDLRTSVKATQAEQNQAVVETMRKGLAEEGRRYG